MKPRLALLTLAVASALAGPAWSLDLLEAWRAAAAHDPEFAAARGAHEAGTARRDQAAALWRPSVVLEAGAARATQESATRGAQFAAPGLGQSSGVSFDTSVTNGDSTRWAVAMRQPLYNRERAAQGEQLRIAADAAETQWRAAQQALMLRSAERYFEAALAAEQLRLLVQQEDAVRRAQVEAQDRFRAGDKPVTDVHEATARAAAVQAQRLAAQSELEVRRAALADLVGAPVSGALKLPAPPEAAPPGSLEGVLERAASGSFQVRAAEAQLRLAEQELRKSDAALSPTLDLVAQAGRERLSGHGDFGGASHDATQRAIGVQLQVPLYTGGMRSARAAESAGLLAKARAELDRERLAARQQARAAWLELAVARERLAALDAALGASRARLDATRVGLQAGDRTTLDLLNAQNDAAAAELAVARARVQVVLQRLRLAAATGDLDEAQLAQANRTVAGTP